MTPAYMHGQNVENIWGKQRLQLCENNWAKRIAGVTIFGRTNVKYTRGAVHTATVSNREISEESMMPRGLCAPREGK